MGDSKQAIGVELIENKIYLIRAQKVMLDRDLAALYGVSTKALNQAVKRNADRFPDDFAFQLTAEEAATFLQSSNVPETGKTMRSQTVTASKRNIRFLPFAYPCSVPRWPGYDSSRFLAPVVRVFQERPGRLKSRS